MTVDQILRDHATAAAVDPPADDWDRLVTRLSEEALADHLVVPLVPPRRRLPARLVAAAAVLVVLVGAAVVVAARPDGRGAVDSGPASEAGAVEPIVPPGVAVSDVPGPQPERVVAVHDATGDGRADLVRLSGLEERVTLEDGAAGLEDLDVTVLVDGATLGTATISSVDVGPDDVAVYALCCDVPEGEIRAVDVATGADLGVVADGTAPAISPDGSVVAVASPFGVQLVDRATGRATTLAAGHDEEIGHVEQLAWSPDGTRLARGVVWRADTAPSIAASFIQVADVAGVLPVDVRWRSPLADDLAGGTSHPAFLADGRLAVVGGTYRGRSDVVGTGLRVLDLDAGTDERRIGGVPIAGLDATADGRWLVATSTGVDGAPIGPPDDEADSALRAFSGEDLLDAGTVGQLDTRVVAAAW